MAQILPSEHVFVAGKNGSGKTFLTKFYNVYNEKRVFVLDTKGTFEWDDIPPSHRIMISSINDLEKTVDDGFSRIIYRPKRTELTQDYYNAFFEFCYYLGNNTVIVDEVMQVCPTPKTIPEFYSGILTRGRELDVNVWSCTQRPANIPVAIYSESTHFFIFKLNAMPDRKRLADVSGYNDFMQTTPEYVFRYFNANTTEKPELGRLTGRG